MHAKANKDGQRGYFGGSWVTVADRDGSRRNIFALERLENPENNALLPRAETLFSALLHSCLLLILEFTHFPGQQTRGKTGKGSGSLRSDCGSRHSQCKHFQARVYLNVNTS